MITLLILLSVFSFSTDGVVKTSIDIIWKERLGGDFSFAKRRSIICDAWCYEWAGTDKIVATRQKNDTVKCYTMMNEATHCSLNLILVDDKCTPTIELVSVAPNGNRIYECKNGTIEIDQALWRKNILKATFDIDFVNDENEKSIFWKGKIYTRIR
jgi:hypothetical protein